MTTEEFKTEAERLRPRLMELANRYADDEETAEDLVQDALLKLWKMCGKLHVPMDALASVVVRNLCINHVNRRHFHAKMAVMELSDDGDSTTDDWRIERMMAIVDALPDFQQTLLRLRHIDGMETKELARLLDMTETAVRQALSRARRSVRMEYRRNQNEDE
ncbi:MAG: sigma-70 family RNA polymerase sigma factor [Prevotella sp.]|nr:sigma-70 family RNA polymerase sigma factor [Prevotella sp.]